MLTLALGLQAPNEDGKPPAYQSVLLVTGLLLLYWALLRLADVLGAELTDGFPAGELTWVSAVAGAVALFAGLKRRSAICLLMAAISGAVMLLAGWEWIFETGTFTASRWLLLVDRDRARARLARAARRLAAPGRADGRRRRAGDPRDRRCRRSSASWSARSTCSRRRPARCSPASGSSSCSRPAAALVAYGAIERSPGPAWLGLANLIVFVIAAGTLSENTLYWWPMLLILLGAIGMAAGLRPRQELPPEPDAYRAGEAPIASRSVDDELVVPRARRLAADGSTVSDR